MRSEASTEQGLGWGPGHIGDLLRSKDGLRNILRPVSTHATRGQGENPHRVSETQEESGVAVAFVQGPVRALSFSDNSAGIWGLAEGGGLG